MHITARRLLGGLLALGVAAGTSACGADAEDDAGTDPAAATSDEGWTYTDDLGTEVELDGTPTRIAGLNDVMASLWNYGVEPVATFGQTSAADDVAFEGRDLADVEIVGESYGQIDLEQLAAAEPDLIITSVYPVDSEGTLDPASPPYGIESAAQLEQLQQIAPVVAIAYRGSAAEVMADVAELAESLGAETGTIEAARAEYDEAAAALTAAGEKGVSVLPVYATPSEGWWMAKAGDDPQLALYEELGVDFVDPGGDGYFWQSVGWEQVPDHPSDVLLYSLRGGMTPEEMAEQPTAARLPALEAEQAHPWKYIGMDYAAQAEYMAELAGWLTAAEDVTP
ncbi:ABC transporter substrate-binding protein [Blastococcus xanthinilyticus]|uniref:ABC transporter substrate-binding protein n=1 Tax=Blastococcus xanthinilyticus TaxID=1564164 RepID=UPI001AA0EC7F|nr:ABC transporter substrate-binding protein [Blastococcus xanthinilyticus]